MEGKGVRDDEEKFSWYVYCWQFKDAHSIWDLISCQIGKVMGMWELQESQQGLNLAHHWDLIKTQSRSLPELTHIGPHSNTHSLHLHSHKRKLLLTPSFFTQTLLDKCTHNHAHTDGKTLTLSHTWTNTFCPMQSHFGLFQTIHCSKAERWCIKLSSI